ncbi:MAG TPA: DNA repair protein RecO [Candidatus Saccharimonadales bacterium]|nr:DNA repair protein RecO [Candidatus Saccharimonadales bacterium]
MNQLKTTGIVLSRTNYGEADRILTMLTPDYGKLRAIARGVRREKSKLAGGIELFSISQISLIRGRGELNTLISTRLIKHYGNIVKDLGRTMLAYELIKQLNRVTEDEPEPEYFELLQNTFSALDDPTIDTNLIKVWFAMQLLRLGGHTPNIQTDVAGNKLVLDDIYNFDFESMSFVSMPNGRFTANHIKLLRLGFGPYQPKVLQQVGGIDSLLIDVIPLVQTMLKTHIRL